MGWRLGIGLAIVLVMGGHAAAAPLRGRVIPLRQPDGTVVQVRVWGDEFYQVVESLDGFTLVRDHSTNIITYAALDAGGALRSTGIRAGGAGAKIGLQPHLRESSKVVSATVRTRRGQFEKAAPKGRSAAPSSGMVSGICVMVDFSDEVAKISRQSVEDFCNKAGYSGFSNNGSVRDYFLDVSNGNLDYSNYVPENYYRAQRNKSYYDNPNEDNGTMGPILVTEVVTWLNNQGLDFSQFDSNNDGYVDALNIFYAGNVSSGWSMGLWPHQGYVNIPVDGVTVAAYQMTDMGDELSIGTFCHENGHMVCDWPDLYDYDFDSNGVGYFCLMGYGGFDKDPVHPCGPLKEYVGWVTATVLSTPVARLSLQTASDVLKYPHPTLTNEYYIVENRNAVGRDAALPDSGIAIWHIDTDASNDYQQGTPDQHYLVALVQADGRRDLENNVNYGDNTDLWGGPSYSRFGNDTVPASTWWSGDLADLDISNIGAPADVVNVDFIPDPFVVTPADQVVVTGPEGGPFSPASETCTLRNIGPAPITWSATSSVPWLTLSSTGGTISPASSLDMSVQINAATLGIGAYAGKVTFTNVGSGASRERAFILRVGDVDDFTELFSDADNDIEYISLTFTPTDSGQRYTVCGDMAYALPTGTSSATTVTLNDDDAVDVAVIGGKQVELFGVKYDRFYVGSNGYITFVSPDTAVDPTVQQHFSQPRISGLFDDLDPAAGGRVSVQQLDDRIAVTYENIQPFYATTANTFQIEMFFTGVIRMTWLGITDMYGLIGLSDGKGVPPGFVETNFRSYSGCNSAPVGLTLSTSMPEYTKFPTMLVTAVFERPVTGFTIDDVVVTNGTASALVGSGDAYSFNLTAKGQGPVTAVVPEGVAIDSLNRPNVEASITRTYDTVPPTPVVGPPSQTTTESGPVDFTITYPDAKTISLTTPNVTLYATGTATAVVSVSGSGDTRTVTLSGISGEGTLAIGIKAGTATDAAGNVAAASAKSTAVTVAKQVIIPTTDVNRDGFINALDIQIVVNAVLGVAPSDAADVNGDGSENALDVQKVVNGALGIS